MVVVTKSTSIPHSPDAVWPVLAEFDAISRWAPNVDHSCLMSTQAEGVGTVRRIQTGRMTVLETVTTYEPGVALGYEITGLPALVASVTNTWVLEPADEGTAITLTTEIVPGPRPPHRLAARAMARVMGSASEQMLAGLAAELEKGRTP